SSTASPARSSRRSRGPTGVLEACELRATLGEARKAVVWNRLPGGGVGHELVGARAHAWVGVEYAHADADAIRIVRAAAEHRRAALATEPFLEPVLGPPRPKLIFAGEDAEASGRGGGVGRRGGSGPPLA